MFLSVCHVKMYTRDVDSAVALYRELGLSLQDAPDEGEPERDASNGSAVRQARLSFPNGGPALVLHNDPTRQFTELAIKVDDLERLHLRLANEPSYIWFEPPHATEHGLTAFVRTPDGNVVTLLGPSTGATDLYRNQDQSASSAQRQEKENTP